MVSLSSYVYGIALASCWYCIGRLDVDYGKSLHRYGKQMYKTYYVLAYGSYSSKDKKLKQTKIKITTLHSFF